jgi:hypothetical protein
MDASSRGAVSKALRWSLAPDGKAYFISASIGGTSATKASITVPLTRAEYYVFESVGA